MFIEFAGMMINTNYITSIYKTESQNKFYEVNVKIYPNSSPIKKIYSTPEERDKAFNEFIEKINK